MFPLKNRKADQFGDPFSRRSGYRLKIGYYEKSKENIIKNNQESP